LVEDYFSRVNVMTTEGEAVRDLAVIHPIESAWGLFCGHPQDNEALRKLNDQFEALQRFLLEEHFDFDYVDEDILSRHGRVEDGRLVVGQARYRAVVVPSLKTIRSKTLNLLRSAQEAGVTIIFVDPVAERVDGEMSDRAKELARHGVKVPLDRAPLASTLRDLPLRRVSIQRPDRTEHPDLLYMLRHDPGTGRYIAFICHTKQDASTGPIVVRMPGKGQVQEWDPLTGRLHLAETEKADDSVIIKTEFPAVGSRIFVFDPEPKKDLEVRPRWRETDRLEVGPKKWSILRDEPNALPLDVGEYCLNGDEWKCDRPSP